MKSSRFPTTILLGVGCLLAGCSGPRFVSVPLERSESEIEESAVPAAALEALRVAAEGHRFTVFEREDRGSHIAYEAEWQEGDVEAEATVLADGGLLEEEIELAPGAIASLPPAIRKKARTLEALGFRVEVARRVFYLFEVDATKQAADGDDEAAAEAWLLRPDGTDATRAPGMHKNS